MKYKKILDEFITNNYDKLIEIANIFLHGKGDPAELLSVTYDTIITARKFNSLENAINRDNLFNFFFVALRNQARGKTTRYNRSTKINLDINTNIEDATLQQTETDFEDIENFNKIYQTLHELYQNEEINWHEYMLFKLYYMNEQIVPIFNLTTQETFKKRNISLRELAKDTGISASAIHAIVNKVLKILKNKLKEKNIL